MKKVLAIAVALVLVFSVAAMAKTKVKVNLPGSSAAYPGTQGMGIGLEFGWNNGLNFKTWLDKTSALQFDANWGFGNVMGIGAAYLMHNYDIIESSGIKLPLYFGFKVSLGFYSYLSYSGVAIGLSVPLGIDIIFHEAPIDVFIQVEPGIAFVPTVGGMGVGFGPGGAVGIRYWLD